MSAELDLVKDLAAKFHSAPVLRKEAPALALAAGLLEWMESVEERLLQLEIGKNYGEG